MNKINDDFKNQNIYLVHIEGSSMEPNFKLGDQVFVHKSKPSIGDVALIDASGSLVLHRLVYSFSIGRNMWFIHKGDNGKEWGLALEKQVLGVTLVGSKVAADFEPGILLFIFKLLDIFERLGINARKLPSWVKVTVFRSLKRAF